MKDYTPTQAEREALYAKIRPLYDEDGDFEFSIEGDTMNFEVKGRVWIDGFVEADTNAFVETSRYAEVTITATDDNGDTYEVDAEEYRDYLSN